MKMLSLLFCLLVSVAFWSCSKGNNPDATPGTTKTDLISASAWSYQDAGVDNNRDGVVDAGGSLALLFPSLVPPCRTDNAITFKKDNTGLVDEGATKCNTADASQTAFNWSFADSEVNLTISNNSFALLNGKSKILSLTATNFTLTRDTVIGTLTIPLVVILKH